MKILVADKLPAGALGRLREIADEVAVDPSLQGETLAEAARDAEVLVVRSTKVPKEVFQRSKRLALVIRAGAGTNTIDVAEAARRGVFVSNCPGRNAVAVAELAMGLVLALDRRIPENVTTFREGRWEKKVFGQAQGLRGRTLGVVGTGTIGREVIVRALAFGLDVVAWSRSLTDEAARELGIRRAESLEALVSGSDIVTLHLALTPETRGLFDRALLGRLKRGALFVNTARAELVDEAALLDLVDERELRVGLDVIAAEPAEGSAAVSSPLSGHPRVYVTHHIGASTEEAQDAVAAEVVHIVRSFAETGSVPNCVNLCARSPATHQLAVRHLDRVGVLAAVLGEISRQGLNAEEMENVVFDGAEAACCFIKLASEPSPEVVRAIEGTENVLGVAVRRLS